MDPKHTLDLFQSDIQFFFTDIDDTMTTDGQLTSEAYNCLWKLREKKIKVIPVTGRPAGWCEMIARLWPVDGVIGENGAFYFRYVNKKMHREYDPGTQPVESNQQKLSAIKKEILDNVKSVAVASDQFCRQMDLAIDFCEDVPKASEEDIQKVVSIFKKHGAQAKVSSIHVNGWFGNYNKVSMTKLFLKREFDLDLTKIQSKIAFSGDSPNDEPMFELFENSFAVANINRFLNQIKNRPKYIAKNECGLGFVEIVEKILSKKTTS